MAEINYELNDTGVANLAKAIVVQAAKDYQKSLCGIPAELNVRVEIMLEDCERFFDSEWFCVFTNMDGEVLMELLDDDCDKFNYEYKKIKKAHGYCYD